jgi:hypothetical protein
MSGDGLTDLEHWKEGPTRRERYLMRSALVKCIEAMRISDMDPIAGRAARQVATNFAVEVLEAP